MSGADTGETERRRDIIYIYICIERESMCMHVVGVFLDLDLISVYGLYGFSVRSLWLCFLTVIC